MLHAAPDGVNINAGCGSTHPDDLQEAVLVARADAGLAFDGDADRVIAVDERGAARRRRRDPRRSPRIDLHDRGLLRGDAVVATVMSNLGLRRALEPYGIELVETPVGDRNVLDELERRNLALGGEQSGHVIFADHATTGDGTLTGIFLLDTMARRGRSLSELAVGDHPGAAGAAQRRGRRRRRAQRATPRSGAGCATSTTSSATTAGCSCARRAPSRWCG